MRRGASWRWTSRRSPTSARRWRPAGRAARPTRRATPWAAAMTSRPSTCPCAARSPTPSRSTPIAAPASPRRTTSSSAWWTRPHWPPASTGSSCAAATWCGRSRTATAIATTIDGGRFAGNIDLALSAGRRGRLPRAARRLGAGGAAARASASRAFSRPRAGPPGEGAEIRFARWPRVAALGTQSNGQGHETTLPADRRRPARPADRCCSTTSRPTRAACATATAMAARARCTWAARRWSGAIDAALDQGAARRRRACCRPSPAMSPSRPARSGRRAQRGLAEVARATDPALGGALDGSTLSWTPLDRITFPNGVHVAEVEVDPETGARGAAALYRRR